jgi:hypothetical protein
MKVSLRTIAATAAISIAMTTLPAFAAASPAAQDQEHHEAAQAQHPDYSKNSYYKTGNREGYQDYQKKQQRKTHNHKYRTDEDRAAHDYGYQQGWQGQRGYNSNNNNTEHPH